jgi:hypothetical protein
MGPLPVSPQANKFLVVATNYLTKWVEVRSLKTSKKHEVVRFVYERIVTRFGILFEMVSNNGLQFINEAIEKLKEKLSIKHKITTIYKPNTNGLVEHTNKVLCNNLSKEVEVRKNLHNWDKQVNHAMWMYNSTFKSSSDFTSFRLTYGVELALPIEYQVMTFCTTKRHRLGVEESQSKRMLELVELEESQL